MRFNQINFALEAALEASDMKLVDARMYKRLRSMFEQGWTYDQICDLFCDELMATAMAENGFNQESVSKKLHVHRNTVRNRVLRFIDRAAPMESVEESVASAVSGEEPKQAEGLV